MHIIIVALNIVFTFEIHPWSKEYLMKMAYYRLIMLEKPIKLTQVLDHFFPSSVIWEKCLHGKKRFIWQSGHNKIIIFPGSLSFLFCVFFSNKSVFMSIKYINMVADKRLNICKAIYDRNKQDNKVSWDIIKHNRNSCQFFCAKNTFWYSGSMIWI